jgi:hypothetical protein
MTWIKPQDQMPESGQRVLVTYQDRFGLWQTIAQHVDIWTELADEGFDLEDVDIDEGGTAWTPEGWYEAPLQCDSPLLEGEVLYWMSIPAPPQEES